MSVDLQRIFSLNVGGEMTHAVNQKNESINQEMNDYHKRIQWIDVAKGIGILLVLLAHSRMSLYKTHHPDDCITNMVFNFLNFCVPAYMPLFYFLSGYTFKIKPNVISSRCSSLLRPYFIWGAIYVLYPFVFVIDATSLLSFVTHLSNQVESILYSRFAILPLGKPNNVIMMGYSGPLWFLTSLFTSYVLFDILIKSSRKVLLASVYFLAVWLLSFSKILLPWSLDIAPLGALFIYAGYLMKQCKLFDIKLLESVILCLLIYILYDYFKSINGGINMSVRMLGAVPLISPFVFFINGVLGSIFICFICIAIEKIKLHAPFAYIGRMSLTLLCCHNLVYMLLLKLFAKESSFYTAFMDVTNYVFLVQIILAIVVSVIIHEASSRKLLPKIYQKIKVLCFRER